MYLIYDRADARCTIRKALCRGIAVLICGSAAQAADFSVAFAPGLNGQPGESFWPDWTRQVIPPIEADAWALHGQTTFLSQYAPRFHAPYRGANSLDSNAGRETLDATLYVGRPLWDGAEFCINPEIDQGFGLSNTLGVAGFPSGEAYKVGFTNP